MVQETPCKKLEVVYVGNLPPGKSYQDIQALFGLYGEVRSVMLLTDSGPGDRFGWVFMTHSEAAVKALDGVDVEGGRLRVKKMGILYPHE